nr:HAD-IB family hydrolase [Asticcacaulis biprosthecium]
MRKYAPKTPSPLTKPPRIATPVVAAFDFDGTLTWKDSFNAFLIFLRGPVGLGKAILAKPGPFLGYLKTRDRGALKSRFLYNLLGDIHQTELEILIQAFVSVTGRSLFRPDAMTTWDSLPDSDVKRVIVTASPELLVGPLGALIGADRVIGTKLGFTADGRLKPELEGINCRGEEKMCRLRAVFGDDFDLDQAYGDTAGDHAMIAAARHGHYRVFKQKP